LPNFISTNLNLSTLKNPVHHDNNLGRAENWDLSKPLQTCSLLVERGGDTLVFSFMAPPESNTVFAQAVIDITNGQTMQYWLEQVADSSRYYVLKIKSSEGREATIGFGFRDREQGTDLRECLQHYEKSIRREKQAETAPVSTFTVPVLGEGEKIHVDRNSGKTSIKKKKPTADGKPRAAPFLLKKPPPPSPEPPPSPLSKEKPKVVAAAAAETPKEADEAAPSSEKDVKKMTAVMGEIDLDTEEANDEKGAGGEIKEGDEAEWAPEFDTK
jgi:hypothetical protein